MDESEVFPLIQKLQENSIGAIDLSFSLLGQAALLQILSLLEANTSVTELYLQRCYLGAEGTSALCNILKKKRNLRVIDLRYNHLSYVELEKLCRALENNFSVLDVLIEENLGDGANDLPFQLSLDLPATPDLVSDLHWSVFTRKDFDRLRDRIQEIVTVNKKTHECVAMKKDELSLYNRHITKLPEIVLIPHLKILDLRNNELYALPITGFDKLTELTELHLDNNKLATLPHVIGSLQKLVILSVKRNNLTQLPSSLAILFNLQQLIVSDNNIREVPTFLGGLKSLKRFDATNNPFLKAIPSDVTDLIEYLRKMFQSVERKKNLRMKLIVLGNKGTGRSSLIKALLQRTKRKNLTRGKRDDSGPAVNSSSSTPSDGIDLTEISIRHNTIPNNEPLTFVAYDFTGPEAFTATHSFFLSERAMNVVVFNMNNPEEDKSAIDQWLQSIQNQAPDSPSILIGTHNDDKKCTQEYVDATFTKLFARMNAERRFPNLMYYWSVSSTTGANMKEFRDLLVQIALEQEYLSDTTRDRYKSLELKITALKDNKPLPPVLSRDAFMKLAVACNLSEADVDPALDHLNALGLILHYNPKDPKLSEYIVLEPQWLHDAVLTLLAHKDKEKEKENDAKPAPKDEAAKLNATIWKQDDIYAAWGKKFPAEVRSFLVALLSEREILFPLFEARSGEYIIPQLLSDHPPLDLPNIWSESKEIAEQSRYYQFEYLPRNGFTKLLVHILSWRNWEVKRFWRYGVIFECPTALVSLSFDKKRSIMKLRVRGQQQVIKVVELDEVVEMLINELIGSEFEVKIPCRHCLQEGRDDDAQLFSRQELEDAVQRTHPFVNCSVGRKPKAVSVAYLVPDIAMTTFSGEKIEFKDLDLGKSIGEGAYATVYEGKWRGKRVAVKQLKLTSMASRDDINVFADFRREVWLMSGLQNEHLLVLQAICMEPFCMVLPFMDQGSLYEFIRRKDTQINWEVRLSIADDVAKAMDFLHSLVPPVVHRDLKSPNILMATDDEGQLRAKVSDFGLSRSLSFQFDGKSLEGHNPVWLAPEILQKAEYNEKVDTYSFGIILWEMLSRSDYFGDVTFMSDIEAMVISGKRPAIPQIEEPSNGVMEDYVELLKECWDNDPKVRPPFSVIVSRIAKMKAKMGISLSSSVSVAMATLGINGDAVDSSKGTSSASFSSANSQVENLTDSEKRRSSERLDHQVVSGSRPSSPVPGSHTPPSARKDSPPTSAPPAEERPLSSSGSSPKDTVIFRKKKTDHSDPKHDSEPASHRKPRRGESSLVASPSEEKVNGKRLKPSRSTHKGGALSDSEASPDISIPSISSSSSRRLTSIKPDKKKHKRQASTENSDSEDAGPKRDKTHHRNRSEEDDQSKSSPSAGSKPRSSERRKSKRLDSATVQNAAAE